MCHLILNCNYLQWAMAIEDITITIDSYYTTSKHQLSCILYVLVKQMPQ